MAFVMEKPVLVLDELEEQMAVVVQELFQNLLQYLLKY